VSRKTTAPARISERAPLRTATFVRNGEVGFIEPNGLRSAQRRHEEVCEVEK